MKRHASLLLIELLIMLLVFAFAAALCLQVFYRADARGRESAATDAAMLQMQNAAELVKANRGDFSLCAAACGTQEGDRWILRFDSDWALAEGTSAYRLEAARLQTDTPLLGAAEITVLDRHNTVVSQCTVCWQEVAA